jgi:tetratricopeptide (TPR) repeat protein
VEVLRATKGEGRELALSLNNLQYLYNKQGQYAEAEVACREALDICRRVFGDRHPETALRMNNLARVMLNLHRVEEAIRYGKEALEIRRGVLKADHPSLALSKQLVGDALVAGGRAAEGEPYLREASETLLSQAGYRGGLAAAAWGRCLMALGKYEEAAVAFEKSVERLKVSPSLERVTIQDVNGWVAELRGKAQQAAAGRASPGRR